VAIHGISACVVRGCGDCLRVAVTMDSYTTYAVCHGQVVLASFARLQDARAFGEQFRNSLNVESRTYIRVQTERFTADQIAEIQLRTGVAPARAE